MSVTIARTRASAWAREMIADPATVFIDTETTGLDGAAEIIDIAVVGCGGEVLLDTLVKPCRPVPPAASAIHGLYDDDLRDAPAWGDVYGMLVPMLSRRPVVIFNVNYDRRIIHQCCAGIRQALPPGADGWHCAMLRYAEYAGVPGRWGKGYRWHTLDKAAAAFGIPPGGHRAKGDADACRRVVHGMARG